MNTSGNTEGEFALVIGGTGAVGEAVAQQLAGLALSIAFTYHSNHAKAEQVTSRLRSSGTTVIAGCVDGLDRAAIAAFLDSASRELGRLKAVVHSASPHANQLFMSKIDPQRFADQVNQDVIAFFNFAQACLPRLRESAGSITAVTTVATRRYIVMDGLSSGPKGAVESIVRAIAAEEGRFGVRANAVGPGILSDGAGGRLADSGEFPPAAQDDALRRTPLRRFGTAREVAAAVRFLVSEDAAYITGQKLDVDGGYSL